MKTRKKSIMKKFLTATVAFALFAGFVPAQAIAKAGTADAATNNAITGKTAEEIVASMTLKQKVEQMIMPAMRQWKTTGALDYTNFTEMNDEARDVIANHNWAGLCLFGSNITSTEQVTALNYDIQQAATSKGNLPYLISCDQEGGRVVRLATGVGFCGNMGLAATGDTNNAYLCGNILGSEMQSTGMNIDFAPDVDVNVNPSNPVINTRSFSDVPEIVSNYGSKFVAGLNNSQTASTIKHFPGHGDTATDSHSGLPSVNKSKAELDQCELAAFKQVLAQQNVDCIMTAHIQFPQVETTKVTSINPGTGQIYLPATLSKTFLTDILRGEMGFKGVACTDAMEMAGIAKHFTKDDAAVRAINAGVDIILMPFDVKSKGIAAELDTYVDNIVAKVVDGQPGDGQIALSRINEACTRVVQMKLDRKVIGNTDTRTKEQRVADASANVGSAEHRAIDRTIADKSITVLKNENSALPLKADNQKIAIMYSQNSRRQAIEDSVNEAVERGILPKTARFEYISYSGGTQAKADAVKSVIDKCDQVLCYTALSRPSGLKPTKQTRAAMATEPGLSTEDMINTYGEEAVMGTTGNDTEVSESGVVDQALAAAHANGKKFIQISCSQPYDVARYTNADAIVATYNSGAILMDGEKTQINKIPSFGAALDVICGAVAPSGHLPVNIPKINADYTYSTSEVAYARGFGITNLNPQPAPGPSPTPAADITPATQGADSAKTGDDTCVSLVLACLVVASVTLAVSWRRIKKIGEERHG